MVSDKERTYYRELYQELEKKYSKEELAEAFVFPPDMSEEEKREADREFGELRKQRLLHRRPEEKMLSGLLRFKYELEDQVGRRDFDKEKGIPHFLSDYLNVTGRKQGELAEDIDLHPTRLSRILHGKEKLSLALAYRLEAHSGDTVPAILWWKLVQQEMEQEIKKDSDQKRQERRQVRRVVYEI